MQHFNTRMTLETRRELEKAAKQHKRSLSREIEARLAGSVTGDNQTEAFLSLLGQVVRLARRLRRYGEPFDWRNSRFDFLAFKAAIDALLAEFAPPEEEDTQSRYKDFDNPEKMGTTLAWLVLMTLGAPNATIAGGGNPLAYVRAAEALKVPVPDEKGDDHERET